MSILIYTDEEILRECMVQEIQSAYAKYKKLRPPKPVPFYTKQNGGTSVVPYAVARKHGYNPTIKPCLSFQFTGTLEDKEYRQQTYDTKVAIEQLQRTGSVLVQLQPSSGKTVIGAYIAAASSKLTFVLAYRKPLIKQWKNTFEKVTNASVWIIHDRPPPSYHVVIVTPRKLVKMSEDIRSYCGLLIIDEADRLCTKEGMNAVLSVQPEYVLSMTATPWKDNGMDKILWLINSGITTREVRRPFTVYSMFTGIRPEYEKGDWHSLLNSIFSDTERNQMILNIVQDNPDKKIMILTRRQEHCVVLFDLFKENQIEASMFFGDMTSYPETRCLIGTSDKIGIGFDEASFCEDYSGIPSDVIIFPVTVLSKSLYYQLLGRGFRSKDPCMIQFVDDDKISQKHWREQKQLITQLGGKILDNVIKP